MAKTSHVQLFTRYVLWFYDRRVEKDIIQRRAEAMYHLQYYRVGVGLCQILLYSRYKRECEIQEGWRRTAEVHNKQFLSEQRWWTAVWNHHSSRTCVNAFMWVWRSGRSTCDMWDVGAAKEGGSFLPFCSHHHHSWMVTKMSTIFMSTCKLGHFTQGRISYINTKKCWCKGSFIPLPMLSWWINLAVILRELCSSFLIFWYFS